MRPLRLLSTALATAVIVTACGTTDEAPEEDTDTQGVTDDSVVIGTHQPLSGPASPGFRDVSTGARAVFDHINDNGGIHGRRIAYQVRDDSFDPAQTMQATSALLEEDEIFAMLGGVGTPTHEAVIDDLNEQGVPDLFVSSGTLQWDQPSVYPYSYGFQVDYTKETKILASYLAQNHSGNDIGLLYQNDDVGPSTHAGVEQYLLEEIVAYESYDPGVPELDGQIAQLEEAGAELVVCSCIPSYLALAVTEAASNGYEPQWAAPSWGGDVQVVTDLIEDNAEGTPAEDIPAEAFLDGLLITAFLPMVAQTDDPWIRFFQEVHEEHNTEAAFTDTTVYGMVQAVLLAQVLDETGPDLGREALVQTLEEQEWEGPGLVPFVATETDHSGYAGVMVVQHNPGEEPEVVQEPMVTDNGGGDITGFDLDRPDPEDVAPFD